MVQLLLHLIQHHTMMAHEGWETVQAFYTSTQHGGDCSTSGPNCFNPAERACM